MTPTTAASINGVSFRLSEDRSRLASFAWTCMFCGQRQRTCTEQGRAESMQRHAAKASHRSAA